MNVAVLLYPGCIFFEVALAAEVLAARARLQWLTPDGATHEASNGSRISADGAYDRLLHERYDAVLVPGGDPGSILLPHPQPAAGLQAQAEGGALVAGICAGNLVMAACGLLRGRRGTHNYTAEHASAEAVAAVAQHWDGLQFERADLVTDGALITAQPWAYRAYAAAVARALGVLDEDGAARLANAAASR